MNQKEIFELVMLKFIDAYVDLNGEINTTVLRNKFLISRSKASKLLGIYLNDEPTNLKYNLSDKTYKKGYFFKMLFLKEDSFKYINAIDFVFSLAD